MHPTRLALTDKAILALPFTTSGQRLVRDAELFGFFVVVGKRTKTFMVQGDLRAKAKTLLGSIAKGIDPRPKKAADAEGVDSEGTIASGSGANGPTLRAAWTRYRDAHLKRKGRNDGTIENFRDHVERLMVD